MQRILDKTKNASRKSRFPVLLAFLAGVFIVISVIGVLLTSPSSPFYQGGNQSSSSTSSSTILLPPAGTEVGPHADTQLLAELLATLPFEGLDYRIEYVEGKVVLFYKPEIRHSRLGGLTFLRQYDIFNQSIPFEEVPY